MFLRSCNKKDVSPIMLHDVTFDSQTHLSHTRGIKNGRLFDASDLMGFFCCFFFFFFLWDWLSNSAHKHWHRDLPWTLPHMYRLAHGALISSLRYICLFLHTQACSGMVISALSGGKPRKKHPMLSLSSNLNVIMQMSFAWSVRQCGHLESTLAVISSTRTQPLTSAADVCGHWTVRQCEGARI